MKFFVFGVVQVDVEVSGELVEGDMAAAGHVREHGFEQRILGRSYAIEANVHVPEGAIPKDGPSAGITMATAMISAFGGRPVRRDVAMTGEITLRGDVLAIGGLKEKVLAARRAGIRTVVMPKANARDLTEIPKELSRDLKFVFASRVDDVLKAALGHARVLNLAKPPENGKKTA